MFQYTNPQHWSDHTYILKQLKCKFIIKFLPPPLPHFPLEIILVAPRNGGYYITRNFVIYTGHIVLFR
jgi:hypothetical protein